MGIKTMKDGRLCVSYCKRHPETRQPVGLKRIVKTQAQAQRVLRELILEVEDKLRKKTIPSWRSLLDDYFSYLSREVSNSTEYGIRKSLERHTLPIWSEKLVDEIRRDDIMKLLEANFSDKTDTYKKCFMKYLRGAFNFALNKEIIHKSPIPHIKFKPSDKINAVLNEKQILVLLRKAQELEWEWYPHYFVACYTGMRNGEIYALTWDNVNIDQQQILVNSSWSGKNGYKTTKSGDDRIVEIPTVLLPLLRTLKLQSNGNPFVLPRLSKWDKGDQARDLRMFLKSIGLHAIRFHDLRASWATLLLGKGVAPSKVMSMGGWKKMDTMMIYMRKAGIDIKGSTACLNDVQIHGLHEAEVIKIGGL